MKKHITKKNIIIAVILILMIIVLAFASNYANKIKDNDEQPKTNETDNKLFNVYLEQGVGTEMYQASDSMPLEDEYTLNTLKSGCVDLAGNNINTPIQTDGTYISTNLNQSSSCYLYYKKKPLPQTEGLDDYLINRGDLVSDNDEYRFTGTGDATESTSPKNFICFGTDSRKKCLDEKDKYLYRIIGVFKDSAGNRNVKLIKYTSLNNYPWHDSATSDTAWTTSKLNKELNGSYFLANTSFDYLQNNDWLNKITSWTWNSVNTKTLSNSGVNYSTLNATNIYLHEFNKAGKISTIGDWTTTNSRIGLMSVSDYALSNGDTISKESWLHISNNQKASADEWTISRSGLNNTNYEAIIINNDGNISSNIVTKENIVRPTFYLNSNVMYISGAGSITSPIILDNYKKPTLKISYKDPVVTLDLSKDDFIITSYCFTESSSDISDCIWINEPIKDNQLRINDEGVYYMHIKDEHGRLVTSSNSIDTRRDSLLGKFKYTGESKTITAEYTGTYIVTGAGAQGNGEGGKGAYLKVALEATKGDVIKIVVGGQECKFGGGLDATGKCTNGGGDSSQIYINGVLVYAASGGGAGDLGTDGDTTTSTTDGTGGLSATGDAGSTATITITPSSGHAGTNGGGGGIGNFYQNCSQYDGPYNECLTGSNTCQAGYVSGSTCLSYGNYTPYTSQVSSCTGYGSAGSSSTYATCSVNGYTKATTTQQCSSYSSWSGYYDCGSYCSEGIYNYYDKGTTVNTDTQRVTWSQGYRKVTKTRGSCNTYSRCSSCSCATYSSCVNSSCSCKTYKRCSSCSCDVWNTKSVCVDCQRGVPNSNGQCTSALNNKCLQYGTKKTTCKTYNRCSACGCSVRNSCVSSNCDCATYNRCSACGCDSYNWSESVSRVSSCTPDSSGTTQVECSVRWAKYVQTRSCLAYSPVTTTTNVSSCSPSSNVTCTPNYSKTTYYGSCTSYNQVYSPCAIGSNTCVGGRTCSVAGDTVYKSGKGGKNYINTTKATLIEETAGTRSGNGYITITR